MKTYRGTQALARPGWKNPVVVIGNFDGVHKGHQALIARAQERARVLSGQVVVLSFAPHPAKVLAPELAPPLLCSEERKLDILAGLGVDACVLEPFTAELAELAPAAFVTQIVCDALGAVEVVVGYDFTYGRARAGTVLTLADAGRRHGFVLHVIEPVTVDGLVASSTKIRELLHEGNVRGAHLLLGRPFDVEGVVQVGAGRGRAIGIPTANVATHAELLPQPGVYATRVTRLDAPGTLIDNAVTNLGKNPTFVANGKLSLEAHLLDFSGDLYGQQLRVAFVGRIRGERTFPDPDALVAQIHEDIAAARRILSP